MRTPIGQIGKVLAYALHRGNGRANRAPLLIGKVLAYVLHPVMLFAYAYLAIHLTRGEAPISIPRFLLIFLLTVVIPVAVTTQLLGLNPVNQTRQQRRGPLVAVLICYSFTLVMLAIFPGTDIVGYRLAYKWLCGVLIVSTILLASTYFGKPSLHAAGMTFASTFFIDLAIVGDRWLPHAIISTVLLLAVIAQRRHSGAHSWKELAAGMAIGLMGLFGNSMKPI